MGKQEGSWQLCRRMAGSPIQCAGLVVSPWPPVMSTFLWVTHTGILHYFIHFAYNCTLLSPFYYLTKTGQSSVATLMTYGMVLPVELHCDCFLGSNE